MVGTHEEQEVDSSGGGRLESPAGSHFRHHTGAAGGIHSSFLGEQSLQELACVCFRDAGHELWD